jgi:hypothetical protein
LETIPCAVGFIAVNDVVQAPGVHPHTGVTVGALVFIVTCVPVMMLEVALVRLPDICIVKETLAPFNDVQEKVALAPVN